MSIAQSIKELAQQLIDNPKAGIKAGEFVEFTVDDITYYGVVVGIFVNVHTSHNEGIKADYTDVTIGKVYSTINIKVWTTTDEEFGVPFDSVTKLHINPFIN